MLPTYIIAFLYYSAIYHGIILDNKFLNFDG
ncbi:MAG: hypothetical protein JWR44_762 [Hymenobacter sp.]|jgi:hypothetical protein|nr:hypothetical protein [Hymenobacter sp.]